MDDSQTVSAPSLIGCQNLEQYLLLAKTARGTAAVELIQRVLEAPGVYVFGELLETECVRELASGDTASYVRLLELFAYGTYKDYKMQSASLPQLTQFQLKKLKHLTIVSLAAKCRTIPYSTLQEELEIRDLRELEDLIIEAVYAGIIQAKLDQRNTQLEVECFIGRDIKMDSIPIMIQKLETWCSNCASVLHAVEGEMVRANQLKADGVKNKDKHDQESKHLRQTMKVAMTDGTDPMSGEVGGGGGGGMLLHRQPLKKGIRGSGAMDGIKVGRK